MISRFSVIENKMSKIIVFLLAVLLLLSIVSFSVEAKAKHLSYDIPIPENSTFYQSAEKFAELIKDRTGGRYIVDLYPNEQLGGGNIIKGMEMLRSGSIDFDVVSTLMYTPFNPKFSVVLMPWIVGTLERGDELLSGEAGKMLFDMVEDVGMHPLGFGEAGFRQITNNKREISSPEDLKGLIIRCPTIKMFVDYFNVLGADPTVIHFAELFTALQQGNADGQENPLDTISSARLQEVQKYMTMWNAAYDAYIMSCSKKLWESLSDEDKLIFSKAAQESMDYQKQLSRRRNNELLEEWKSKMEITILTPEQMSIFREAVQPVYDKYEDIIGLDLLNAFGYKKK